MKMKTLFELLIITQGVHPPSTPILESERRSLEEDDEWFVVIHILKMCP
jgi:hypothetical protein